MLSMRVVTDEREGEMKKHRRALAKVETKRRAEMMNAFARRMKRMLRRFETGIVQPPSQRATQPLSVTTRVMFGLLALVIVTFSVDANAKDIQVASGDVQGLIDAINFANVSENPDVIVMEPGEYYFDSMNNKVDGKNALPQINTKITIRARGAVIARQEDENCHRNADPHENLFRFFHISQRGDLTLEGISLAFGCAIGSTDEAKRGGAVYVDGGKLKLVMSQLPSNYAREHGGAIYVTSNGRVEMERSAIQSNRASGNGGGLYVLSGSSSISSSMILGNEASGVGGGIYNRGILDVKESTLHRNEAGDTGGGIFNDYAANAKFVNSTISRNFSEAGAGIHNLGSANVEFIYTTIYANEAETGGGIHNESTLVIAKSIVAANTPDNCFNEGFWESANPNLDDDGSCEAFNLSDDPLLFDLNGEGTTAFHALSEGSPAIDAVPFEICSFDHDQRFADRPKGNGCDLGSYESDYEIGIPEPGPEPLPVPPTPQPEPTPTPNPNPGGGIQDYDADGDCQINDSEFFNLIDAWLVQELNDEQFFDGVDAWIGQESVCVVASSAPRTERVNASVLARGSMGYVFSMSAPSATGFNVEIFSMNGKALYSSESGDGKLFWNLRTGSGKPVANGVYIARLTLHDNSGEIVDQQIKRIVVLR